MPARKKARSEKPKAKPPAPADVASVVAWLERAADPKVRDGMARYGLPSDHALGIAVGTLRKYAKELGTDHRLALALWSTGIYEARLLAAFVDDAAAVTVAQMDRWCRDFDNWGVVDTVCFALFDRSPHAWGRVEPWAARGDEFGRRAGFVLLACLALHDRAAEDEAFLRTLPWIERAATDHRNFVRKGVSWALRSIGARNARLHAAALELAGRLADSESPAERWVGKDTLRDITRPLVTRRLAGRGATARSRAGAATSSKASGVGRAKKSGKSCGRARR